MPSRTATARPVRRGRPPASRGAATESRILSVAIDAFGDHGYSNAALSTVAAGAGITVPALYNYFASKRELYVRVFEEVERVIFERLHAAVAAPEGLVARLEAVLDEVVALNLERHSVSEFYVSLGVDSRRNPEIAELGPRQTEIARSFYAELVEAAIAAGELGRQVPAADYVDLIMVTTAGLAQLSVNN